MDSYRILTVSPKSPFFSTTQDDVSMMYFNTTLGLLKSSAWDEIQTVVFEVQLLPYSAP